MLKAVRKVPFACPMLSLPVEIFLEAAVADEIEQAICQSLPVLAGLTSGMADGERLEVFKKSISTSFVKFVALHGDPFGCEINTALSARVGGSLRLVQENIDAVRLPRQVVI